jgi:LacI family transcriptional regulator
MEVLASPSSLEEASAVADQALAASDPPSALFCLSDSIAYGCFAAARDRNLEIPGQLSIVGYDDHPVSKLLSPALTTVDWDLDSIIRSATSLVVSAIEGKPRRRRMVKPPTLRNRASTGPCE